MVSTPARGISNTGCRLASLLLGRSVYDTLSVVRFFPAHNRRRPASAVSDRLPRLPRRSTGMQYRAVTLFPTPTWRPCPYAAFAGTAWPFPTYFNIGIYPSHIFILFRVLRFFTQICRQRLFVAAFTIIVLSAWAVHTLVVFPSASVAAYRGVFHCTLVQSLQRRFIIGFQDVC